MKKIILYLVIFFVVTYIMSPQEWVGVFENDEVSWLNIIVKFVVFGLLSLLFEKVIKPKIFKNE